MDRWNRLGLYAAGLGGVAVTLVAEFLLDPYLHGRLSWALVLIAVMFASLGTSLVLLFQSFRHEREQAAARGRHAARLEQELNDRQLELSKVSSHARSVVDHVVDGIISIDHRGIVESFNPASERIFGYAAAEVIGRNVSMLMPDPYHSEHDRYIGNYLETGHAKIIGLGREVSGRRKDGSVFPMDLAVSEFRSNDRRYFVGIVRDVTDRNRAAEDLRAAKDAAEDADRAKSQFLANISHELRTPMNAILGMTELALGEDLPDAVRDYLRTAKDSADVLLELLNELLDFSRIEAGRMEIESAPFRLRAVIDQTLKALGVRAHEKGLELACDLDSHVPDPLLGDPLRLRQVLVNLLGNAVKFTERGEVVLRINVDREEDEEVLLRFAVADTGIGIAPQDQQRIFAPFTQADPSTTRHYGGTGLGLAIAKSIVELMGGRVWVESELGRGSTFSFTARLRLQPGRREPQSPAPESRQLLQGMHVLVVDDNDTNRRILEQVLLQAEMLPHMAADATAGLAQLHAAAADGRPFPLVILDAMMPGIDGFTLAEWIKGDPRLAPATILMLSSANRQLFARRCERLQLSCLEKPISQSELIEAVLRLMAGPPPAPGRAPAETPGAETVPPRPLRVLVVEDTPANQKLIETILCKRGHTVTLVKNGREALDQIRHESFDLVLMDVQMPVMDGFQATAAVRALEDPQKRRLPIVAMTAHAIKGDRERCLAAGMDDYIAKPIDRRGLIAVVEQRAGLDVGPPSRPADVPAAAIEPATEPRGSTEIFNLGESVARLNGDMDMFRQVVEFFFEDYDGLVQELHETIRRRDAASLARAAHSLKGLAAGFNAPQAVSAALAVEQLGQAGQIDSAAERVDELEHHFGRLLGALAVYRPRVN